MENTVLTDSAYEAILELILTAEIEPGSRIREDQLAEKFGISRTPVREAVNRLVQNGFVVNVKRKGLYCIQITKPDFLDLLDLRFTLESLAFKKCIELATKEDIAGLRELISNFHYQYEYIRHNSGSAVRDAEKLHNFEDVKFHVQIARVSRSERLIRYISEVENSLLLARQRIYKRSESGKIIMLSWEQHTDMLDAIEARDKESAARMFQEHLKLMRDTQIDAYD